MNFTMRMYKLHTCIYHEIKDIIEIKQMLFKMFKNIYTTYFKTSSCKPDKILANFLRFHVTGNLLLSLTQA